MARQEQIAHQRLEKLEKIRRRGVNPYPSSYHRSHTTKEAISLFEQQEASVQDLKFSLAGRITASRLMGKIAFFDIHSLL